MYMLKSLYCEDISVEYEFKSVKFKEVIDRLKMKTQRNSGNTTDSKNRKKASGITHERLPNFRH